MQNYGAFVSHYGVENHGIKNAETVYWNLTTSVLYEQAIRRHEAAIAHLGPLVVQTGSHTGRSPNDKFVVQEPSSESDIWWGKVNRPFSQENFDYLYRKMLAYTQNRDIFVFDGYVGADLNYRMPVRIITEYAWHNLFARNMFIREFDPEKLRNHVPEFTVIDMPRLKAEPGDTDVCIMYNTVAGIKDGVPTRIGYWLWDAPTDYDCVCTYASGLVIRISSGYPMGTKWVGEDGWLFVTRGKTEAEPASVLDEVIGENEVRLYHSRDHCGNFIDCVKSRKETITPCEVAHRSASVGHLCDIALYTGRKIRWNPKTEEINGDPGAWLAW